LSLTVDGEPRFSGTSGPGGTDQREQATFGNEVDFVGDPFSAITEIGFHVYTTAENNARGNPNMPNIKIEIDPNLSATPTNFSTLTFQPENSAAGWSGYINAATAPTSGNGQGWYLSTAAGVATGCTIATPCTFTQVKTALADGGDAATIYTIGIGKGRDFAWEGAVDGLRVNGTIYDFEPFGVIERAAS
jgi:hypothetical protein